MRLALAHALEHMSNGKKWMECCEHSISVMSSLGFTFITRSRTLSSKHLMYRQNDDCFPNPLSPRISKKKADPPIFSKNPVLKNNIIRFCKMNLNILSIDLVKEYLEHEEIPRLLNKHEEIQNNPNYTYQELLEHNGLKKINGSTICKWMIWLVHACDIRKKTYYVDAHENPETIEYRKTL